MSLAFITSAAVPDDYQDNLGQSFGIHFNISQIFLMFTLTFKISPAVTLD